jgi:WD40 repeat protein
MQEADVLVHHAWSSASLWHGECIGLHVDGGVDVISFDPSGRFCAVSLVNGNVELWDVQLAVPIPMTTLKLPTSGSNGSREKILSFAWSLDGMRLCATTGPKAETCVSSPDLRCLFVWNTASGVLVSGLLIPFNIATCSFAPNSHALLVLASADVGLYVLVNTTTGKMSELTLQELRTDANVTTALGKECVLDAIDMCLDLQLVDLSAESDSKKIWRTMIESRSQSAATPASACTFITHFAKTTIHATLLLVEHDAHVGVALRELDQRRGRRATQRPGAPRRAPRARRRRGAAPCPRPFVF